MKHKFFPVQLPFFDQEEWAIGHPSSSQGLSVYEDEEFFYAEAALPGLAPEEINISIDQNALTIEGEKKHEKKGITYHKRATQSYSYHLSLPNNINPSKDPEAHFENGIVYIKFKKSRPSTARKIPLKK